MLTRVFPILTQFKGYNAGGLRADVLAGLTVALVLIPQSMAYAQLAGLPAYYGLYAAFLPPMVAALFGSSRQLATGPVAVVSLMTSSTLEPLATAGGQAFIAYAVLLALMVGAFQLLLGVFRLGIVVNLISHPVIIGFTNAAAIIIATSQLPKIFGVHVETADHHYQTVYRCIREAIHHTHLPTLGLAVLAFAIMVVLRRINPRIPVVLVAAVVTTVLAWATGFERTTSVPIDQIQSPAARDAIRSYNGIVHEVQAIANIDRGGLVVSKVWVAKATTTERAEAICSRCHNERDFTKLADGVYEGQPLQPQEIMQLAHYAGLPGQYQSMLKRKCEEFRRDLRDQEFEAVAGSDGRMLFYPMGQVPAGDKTDGRVWRALVRTMGAVDESAVQLSAGGAVVGVIPKGLPRFGRPHLDVVVMSRMLVATVIISLLGFMEAISIAKAMATKTGQRLDPNQELIGQGLSNILGSLGQSYPVSGSFSRSAVNLQSGGVTGLSNILSGVFVALTLFLFTPALHHLPQAVLAAIIMMAVVGILSLHSFVHAYRTQHSEGIVAGVTFVATLVYAPHLDRGIITGVLLTVVLLLFRQIAPGVALLSRHWDTTFRSAERFGLAQCLYISLIRFRGSLTFASCSYLEEKVLNEIANKPALEHIVIVGNGINEIDASGEATLVTLVRRVREAGYDLFFTGLNDNILDVFHRTGLYEQVGEDHFFRNATMAVDALYAITHDASGERECPLMKPIRLEERDVARHELHAV